MAGRNQPQMVGAENLTGEARMAHLEASLAEDAQVFFDHLTMDQNGSYGSKPCENSLKYRDVPYFGRMNPHLAAISS